MLKPTMVTCLTAVVLAAAVEITANFLLAKSNGFTRYAYAAGALFCVGIAFTFLAYAVQVLDLAVAYALWGGFGILGTSIGGWILFGQRLRPTAWLGIVFLISGMTILHLS